MGLLLALLFLIASVVWVAFVIALFAVIGAVAYTLYRQFTGHPVGFPEALGTVVEGMLGGDEGNRRWATMLGVVGLTFVVALCTPGDSLLPSVPGDLWGTLDPGFQKQISGWWHWFWGGDFPVPVVAPQGSWFGWFFSWEFWMLLVLWLAYTLYVFAEDLRDAALWILDRIDQRRQAAAATQAAAAAAQQKGGSRRGQQQPPQPPQAPPQPPQGGGWARTIFEALGLDVIVGELFFGERFGGRAPAGAGPRPPHAIGIIGALALALVFAIVLRLLVPVPVLTAFAVILFLYILGRIESRFGGGIATIRQWFRALGSAIGAVAVFVALRFLAGQVLGYALYPSTSWDLWGYAGGVKGIFWSTTPVSLVVIWEILFWFVAGGLAFAWYKGKARRFLGMIFVFALLLVIAQFAFPEWVATVPPQKAIAAKLVKVAPLDAPLKWGEPTELACDNSSKELPHVAEVELSFKPGCTTRWVSKPPTARGFEIHLVRAGNPMGISREKKYADGSAAPMELWNPFARKWDGKELKAIRWHYAGPGEAVVRIKMQ